MGEERLKSVNVGNLYLEEIRATDYMAREADFDSIERQYVVTFANRSASVSFAVPESLLPEIIGCDAIAFELNAVHTDGDGER